MAGAEWVRFDPDDLGTRPMTEGRYAIMVSGDEESDGPHVFYSYDDYQTMADGIMDEFDPGGDAPLVSAVRFRGDNDEEDGMVFAWLGPLANEDSVPPCNFETK